MSFCQTGATVRFVMRQSNYSIQFPNIWRLIGTLEGVYLTNLLNWYLILEDSNQLTEDGFFYHEQYKITHETGICSSTQERILKYLKDLELIDVSRRGMPSKNYYKPNLEKIQTMFFGCSNTVIENQITKRRKINIENIHNVKQCPQIDSTVLHSLNDTEQKLSANESSALKLIPLANPSNPVSGCSAPIVRRRIKVISNKHKKVIVSSLSLPNGNDKLRNKLASADAGGNSGTSTVRDKLIRNGRVINGTPRKTSKDRTKVMIPKKVNFLFTQWESFGFPISRRGTLAFKEDVLSFKHLLDGTAFKDTQQNEKNRVFTIEEISMAIQRFALSANNPEYLPANQEVKRKLKAYTPKSFVLNPYSGKSSFLFSLENAPKLLGDVINAVEASNPRLANKLLLLYQTVIGRSNNFTQIEKNVISEAANKLEKFYRNDYLPACNGHGESVYDLAKYLMEGMIERFDITKINVNLLTKDFIFREFFPAYLTREGLWDKSSDLDELD